MVTSVVGVAYSGPTNSISTASYNNNTGILQITTVDKHNLIVNGFVKDVIQRLPMEFAVEANKLLEVTLEGSVG